MIPRPLLAAALAAAGLTAPLAPAVAHHSSAAYDLNTKLTLSGTVKSFEWLNPHTWVTLSVPDGKGGTEDWRLEGGSVSILVRNGWSEKLIQPGDKVKLLISPRKDKAAGGEFYTVLEKNGQKVAVANNG